MASTLCQYLVTIFGQKTQNFVWFGPYDFVQTSLACGSNTYQIMYGETCNQVKGCTKHGRPDQFQQKLTVALNCTTCTKHLYQRELGHKV